ncbi:MAG: hypothetical protein ACXVUX_01910 [Solirubrobacteraceae bacterium]
MSAASELSAERIAERAREDLHDRLRAAFAHQLAVRPLTIALGDGQLDQLVDAAAARAGGVLWRRCLAGVAADALGIGLAEAVSHPEVQRAHELVGAPPYEETDVAPAQTAQTAQTAAPEPEPEPGPGALRVAAVHLGGIESLRRGEDDLELRFSAAGLDVLKASSGAAIGRLGWTEIESVSFSRSRRGLRAGRRQELHVETARGRASFELPGLSDRQLQEDLEPLLARWHPVGR